MAEQNLVPMHGASGVELVVERLQRAMDDVEGAANYFQDMGLEECAEKLDGARGEILALQEILECLLGRVELHLPVGGVSGGIEPVKAKAA